MTRTHWIVGAAVLAISLGAVYTFRDRLFPAKQHADPDKPTAQLRLTQLQLTPQARRNLGLETTAIQVQKSYRRTVQVPGTVVDRPGHSDRGVPAPVVSVVLKIHAFPGDLVRPGDKMFTLRLVSEYLQTSQADLFKNTRDAQMAKEQRDRLAAAAKTGAVPEAKLIEFENQVKRLQTALEANRQDLLARGLTKEQVDQVADGKFVSEVDVLTPLPHAEDKPIILNQQESAPAYEVQELKVELGQQVQAGQVLCVLANHQSLYIEGHAFRREAPFFEEAAQKNWPIQVEFSEETRAWPALDQTFTIRHLANMVDPNARTFSFFIPLVNQARAYEKEGKSFLVWRFRPGQQVRLHIPIEECKGEPIAEKPGEYAGVIVLPPGAVAKDGADTFVFRENGDDFDQKPVHVLYEDTNRVVIAAEGGLPTGVHVAANQAASLLRILKAQSAKLSGGLPPGFHAHPDGTVHGAH